MLAMQSFARVCPCVTGRCLSASLSRAEGAIAAGIRHQRYSTSSGCVSPSSIFSPDASPWDNIFEDVKSSAVTTQPSTANVRSLKYHPTGYAEGSKQHRAIAMTQRESQAFADMFNTIFDANAAAGSQGAAGVGQHSSAMSNLFSRLRHSKRPRWTSEVDEELDRKKEEMELCETDLQLLEWAMREVFGESQRYEEEARRAMEAAEGDSPDAKPSRSARKLGALQLQPAFYPHLIAALMRTFRDKYKDPHLALAMFEHARSLSVASFVYGCTTPAYNELVETRWQCFRDLRGACDALEEMRVNGIEMDNRTRLLAETIRREVGERTLWQEESWIGSGEVWEMVGRLERLAVHKRTRQLDEQKQKRERALTRKRRWSSDAETWKAKAMDMSTRDDWRFDRWTGPDTARTGKTRMRN
ncbi:hypothetical protein K466DRAFT_487786 [Polyporus arcularius HHB13444]|uniref:Mtf2-like C-terminal domain-containing protein n=1 Tax=Polyporus arcularius HHB13444 TaxID=1314778 RepID=A0A5C3PIS2_9APHY|nr:hypothetical protein K466DRAFT_487786 [Polyporus arcularius HHB13444]